MTQRFPKSILKHGCQTEVTTLCVDRDITVRTTLDTGCSPNNYLSAEYFNRNVEALSPFLVSSIPERVDLATSGSTQPITAHAVLDIRHVDGCGRIRLIWHLARSAVRYSMRYQSISWMLCKTYWHYNLSAYNPGHSNTFLCYMDIVHNYS